MLPERVVSDNGRGEERVFGVVFLRSSPAFLIWLRQKYIVKVCGCIRTGLFVVTGLCPVKAWCFLSVRLFGHWIKKTNAESVQGHGG